MKPDYIVIHHTSEYRGDHAADITFCYRFQDLETVLSRLKGEDWVEIKRIAEGGSHD